jgi:hypothetical protein
LVDETDTTSELKLQLELAQKYVRACARLIEEQVRLLHAARRLSQCTKDAEHTLEIMIEFQVAHIVHRDRLRKALRKTGTF